VPPRSHKASSYTEESADKWDKRIASALPTSRHDTADLEYRDEDGEAAED
jgi:hypothetical protein